MRNAKAEQVAQDEVMRASAWEGHAHPWPPNPAGFVACPECGLTVHASDITGG